MFIKYIFCFYIFMQAFVFAENSGSTENILEYRNEAGESCMANLQSCSIKFNELPENGRLMKLKGEKGNNGERGFAGLPGMNGLIGEKGERGFDGLPGHNGPIGPKGQKGEPGEPGRAQMCLGGDDDDPSPTENSIGSKAKPFRRLCESVNSSANFWVNPSCPIQVFCDKNNSATCVIKKNLKVELEYGAQRKPFWLSELYDLKKIYETDINEIEWLRQQSWKISLKIRYHCFNSQVYDVNDPENNLYLLTWNDRIIGPEPMDLPFYYSTENNNCSSFRHEAEQNKWSFTDIIVTGPSSRLPIVDMQVRSIQSNLTQKIRLELLELCFK